MVITNSVVYDTSVAASVENLLEARFGYPKERWNEAFHKRSQVVIRAQGKRPEEYLYGVVYGSDQALPLRAFALALLRAPTLRWAPFLTEGQRELLPMSLLNAHIRISSEIIRKDSPELFDFDCTLIAQYVDAVSMDSHAEHLDALYYYNQRILEVLGLLSERDPRAKMLFDRYQLNDPVSFMTRELCDLRTSGYNPLYLLWSAKIPNVWKERADEAMRSRILREECAGAKPRVSWERALSCYVSWIEYCLCVGPKKYSSALFERQVRFVLDTTKTWGVPCFHDWHVPHIWQGLTDPEVRREFARRVLLVRGLDDLFPARDPDARTFVAGVLVEFPEDKEIATRVRATIAEQDKRAARMDRAVWV